MKSLSLAEYRKLPPAQRDLANWRRMSGADRSTYLESGGADAPVNNPSLAVGAAPMIDPAIAATVARMHANYAVAKGEAAQDPAVTAVVSRMRANYEAASGFKCSSNERADG